MNKEVWKSWSEVKSICQNKKVILWGRSDDWVHKTVPKLNNVTNDIYIVDVNISFHGTTYNGLNVYSPEKLKTEESNDFYILITSGGAYNNVYNTLVDLGYEPGKDFCCSPEFKDWGLLQEIRNYDKDIIISSSDYSDNTKKRFSKSGGGIYVYNTKDNTLKKKIDGHCRQITKIENKYYVVEFVEKKVLVLNENFEKEKELLIDQTDSKREKPSACGIAFHEKKGLIFIANSGSDTINIYDKDDFKFIDTIHISDKFKRYGDGQHHINDLTVADNLLFVSGFSISGNWKKGIMDGGVIAYDLNHLSEGFKPLFSNLWKPHSVEYIDGNICVLDSMNGNLWIGNKRIEGEFPGFARGLTYDGRFYYVGQSETMYMKNLFNVKNNIMCNAGVYLFDVESKASRFYSFPDIMNVHDLLVVE